MWRWGINDRHEARGLRLEEKIQEPGTRFAVKGKRHKAQGSRCKKEKYRIKERGSRVVERCQGSGNKAQGPRRDAKGLKRDGKERHFKKKSFFSHPLGICPSSAFSPPNYSDRGGEVSFSPGNGEHGCSSRGRQ